MRIGFDIAQTCVPKAGCGWVADCLAREFLRIAPTHEYVWYHHFDSWINVSTEGAPTPSRQVLEPFRGVSPTDAARQWNEIRQTGRLPGDPEIVHAHSFNAPKLSRGRLVFTAHDVSFWVHPEYTTDINRLTCQRGVVDALANADGFYFISHHARAEFDRMTGGWLGETGRPCLVHHLAPRQPAPERGWRKGKGGPWLFVGSLEPRKNLNFLLDAYRIYASESSQPRPLRLVGAYGWLHDSLVDRIAAWSHRGSVHYAGYVDETALLAEYRDAFCLLFPSHYEGFGLPILEAMQQHTPVICGRVTSLPEVGGEAAIYTDICRPEIFARAMLDLERDQARHEQLSALSAQHASRYTWEGLVGALESFYQELLAAPRVDGTARRPRSSGISRGDSDTSAIETSMLSNPMSSTANPPVDIDILMERIRSEVTRRRAQAASGSRLQRSQQYELGRVLHFEAGGDAEPYLAHGWSEAEPQFRWTDGPTAELVFVLNEDARDLVLSFRAHPMLGPGVEAQVVSASWNGIAVGEWTISEDSTRHTLVLSVPRTAPSTSRLTFHLPQAFSPLSKNQGADARRLGLAFRELVLRPANDVGFKLS